MKGNNQGKEILKLIKDNYDIKYVQELSITLKDVFKGLYKKQSYIIFCNYSDFK